MLCPMPFGPLPLENRRKGRVYFCHSPWKHTPEWVGIFARNFIHADKNSLQTFWHTKV